MYTINRGIAIIKPKQPFVDWENNLPDKRPEITLEDRRKVDCAAYLIREVDNDAQAKREIEKIWRDIFEEELWGWCTNEDWWPKNLTKKMFWEWFDVEFHSTVIDVVNRPIEKEEMQKASALVDK